MKSIKKRKTIPELLRLGNEILRPLFGNHFLEFEELFSVSLGPVGQFLFAEMGEYSAVCVSCAVPRKMYLKKLPALLSRIKRLNQESQERRYQAEKSADGMRMWIGVYENGSLCGFVCLESLPRLKKPATYIVLSGHTDRLAYSLERGSSKFSRNRHLSMAFEIPLVIESILDVGRYCKKVGLRFAPKAHSNWKPKNLPHSLSSEVIL